MKKQDTLVSNLLNELHQKTEQSRAAHFTPSPLKKGDKVWNIWPEKTGDKLSSRWLGPTTMENQVGEASYVMLVKSDKYMSVHRRFSKECIYDPYSGTPLRLYYFQQTKQDEQNLPGEFTVKEII